MRGQFTGQVTLDGQPLKEGVVRFVPVDGQSPTASAKISNGRFSASVPLGTMRVEISAAKIFPGGAKGAGGEPVPEEFVSPEYNAQSKLTAEVKPEGPNNFEFKLHGRKK